MNTHTDHHTTMLVTLSGRDRPGITRDLFTACSAQPVEVTDVDQIVMRDQKYQLRAFFLIIEGIHYIFLNSATLNYILLEVIFWRW